MGFAGVVPGILQTIAMLIVGITAFVSSRYAMQVL
jgi:hypothetical protein